MIHLNADQAGALDKVIGNLARGVRFQRIMGAAGTGKTTMLSAVVDALGGHYFNEADSGAGGVGVLAPTNKAAMILRQKGVQNATTCHRAVTFAKPPSPEQVEELELMLEQAREQEDWPKVTALEAQIEDVSKLRFKQRDGSIYRCADLLIIDEAGMVPGNVADWIRDLDVPILAIGDPHQLPPVNDPAPNKGFLFAPGNPDVPTFILSTVERQGEGSGILKVANMIRMGQGFGGKTGRIFDDVVLLDMNEDKHVKMWTHHKGTLFRDGYQFITFSNYTRRCLINEGRKAIHGYKQGTPPRPGEPYICVHTNRTLDVLNADSVTLTDVSTSPYVITAKVRVPSNPSSIINYTDRLTTLYRGHFEDTVHERRGAHDVPITNRPHESWLQVDWSYAMTCHKMQGDETDKVVVVLQPGVSTQWLYTACTRARSKLYIVRMEP